MRTVVAVALCLICSVPLFAQEPFPEWPKSQWLPMYDRAIQHVQARRLLAGYPDCTVRPERDATRYEWAAVLSRMAWYFDLELPDREYLPADVPWNHWCADACQILTASRLYPTPKGTQFCGNQLLTRGDYALMACNLMQALEGVIPPRRLSDVGNPYLKSVEKLIANDMLVLMSDGKPHPEKAVPRWQICVTVHRLLVWNEKRAGPQLHGPVLYRGRDGRR